MKKLINLQSKTRKYVDVYEKISQNNVEYLPELTSNNIQILLDSLGIELKFNEITKETFTNKSKKNFDFMTNVNIENDDEKYEEVLFSYLEDEIIKDNFRQKNYSILCRKLNTISFMNTFNPVKSWLEDNYNLNIHNLDKQYPELEKLYTMLKFKNQDNTDYIEIQKKYIKKWLVSCIASQFEEKFESHGVLTFTGEQGIGKTSFMKKILPNKLIKYFYSGFHLDVKNKDSKIEYNKNWIVELGEIGSMLKKDMDSLKAFITNSTDLLRNPYGTKARITKRKTVAFGSADTQEFLKDDTNRRFWVIDLFDIDLNLKIDPNKLWCELYDLYLSGEKWYLTKDEISILNQHNTYFRMKSDTETLIETMFDFDSNDRYYMTATEICRSIIKETKNISSTKVGKALNRLNIEFEMRRSKQKVYKMPPFATEFYHLKPKKTLEKCKNEEKKETITNENSMKNQNNNRLNIIVIKDGLIPHRITKLFDLNITDKKIVKDMLFIDDNNLLYIPNFTTNEVKSQCLENLLLQKYNIKFTLNEDLFKQLNKFKQISIKNFNLDDFKK